MVARLLKFAGMLLIGVTGWTTEIEWPVRGDSTNSPLTVVSGRAPVDLGRIGKCRVFALGRDEGGGDRFLLVTEYDRDRGNTQVVSIRHAVGTCRLSLRRHNGSTAVYRATGGNEARGLFVYLTGIIGLTPPEEKLVETFRAAGWNTLVSETSFNFMRRRSVLIDPDNIEATARGLGHDVNDQLADKAYAVEAMLRVIATRRPGERRRPRVLAGGSAGSIAVPVVAARIGGSAAVILIGSGGNVGRILCESSLEPIAFHRHMREGGQVFRQRLSEADLRRVGDAIQAHTPLDPLRLAPMLPAQPVLLMRGELDEMVPAETNDLLWRALGKPQRWSLPVNHLVLFGMLQFQSGTILKWTEQALSDGGLTP